MVGGEEAKTKAATTQKERFFLDNRVKASFETLTSLSKDLQDRYTELNEKENSWKLIEERMALNAAKFSNKINLNIGGKRFTTSKGTLMSQPSYFKSMLESDHCQKDEDGEFFIDRSPKLFGLVLDYLRTGRLTVFDLSKSCVEELKSDFSFFQIPFPSPFFGTSILSDPHTAKLQLYLPYKTFKLLYKASVDGFDKSDCHNKIDNQGPTVMIIQTTQNSILGGYASANWNSSKTWIYDDSAFIFSLYNGFSKKFPIKNATCALQSCGFPSFGADIVLSNSSNKKICYVADNFIHYESVSKWESRAFVDGSTFLVSDIEVFSVC